MHVGTPTAHLSQGNLDPGLTLPGQQPVSDVPVRQRAEAWGVLGSSVLLPGQV